MGQSISKIRKEAEEANEADRAKMEERMQILEKMVQSHLEKQQHRILAGERGDQEIHSGTVVEEFKQVNLVMEGKASQDLEDAIDDFFSGSFMTGLGKLMHVGVKAVLGNMSMGEYETSTMIILWTHNALLRCDTYCYRWNFSSKGVIEKVEGAVGILMVQRVIDITKTDPQVLTWAITRQARALGNNEAAMIDEAMAVVKKVAMFQKEIKMIQNETEEKSIEKDE